MKPVERVSFTLFGRKPLHSERPAASASRTDMTSVPNNLNSGSSRMSRKRASCSPPPMHPHWATQDGLRAVHLMGSTIVVRWDLKNSA